MSKVRFFKVHGLGNDFVVLDFRCGAIALDEGAVRKLADRRTGVGCDQVILLEPPRHPAAQVLMRIRNADGSEAEACGSGACAALVAAHRRRLAGRRAIVELDGGALDIAWREDGHVIMTGPAALSFEGAFDTDLLTAG